MTIALIECLAAFGVLLAASYVIAPVYGHILGVVVFGLFLGTVGTCFARDNGQFGGSSPERREWFQGLKSGKGPCCADADGTALSDVEWDSKDGHYRVMIDNQWIDVPDEAVIKAPNLDGRTIVWPVRGYLGTSIRCFIIGAQY